MATLTANDRKNIATSKFADPRNRRFPLEDKAHIRSALSYIRYADPATAARIRAKAKAAGVGKSINDHKRVSK